MAWHSINITVEIEAVEAVEFAFNSLEALGTAIDYMSSPTAGVCIVGYFDRLPDDRSIQDELHYALNSYDLDENAIISIEREAIQDADWLTEWKKHWKPTNVGRFVVAAPWHDLDEPTKIVIRIEPNMAFGTGTHETTQLCLKAIDELYTAGGSFLDVGTGTGILTIAAALKGRNLNINENDANTTGGNTSDSECVVLGIDIDREAVRIARENAELNNVSDAIGFHEGPIDKDTPTSDFVCANLTLDVILPILPMLLAKSSKYVVLSGILAEQEEMIRKALNDIGVIDPHIDHSGEWIAVIVTK